MEMESFVRLHEIENGLFQLTLDMKNSGFNILSCAAITELKRVISQLPTYDMRGLLIASAKPGFVVGADITEFCESFAKSEDEIFQYGMSVHALFNAIEDLPFPTVTAIGGEALGGGLELALATDLRVATSTARVGLPEVNLGIMPGWGGSVRLTRLVGVDNALNWMTQGRPFPALEGLKVGVVDAVVEPEDLLPAATQMLSDAATGKLNHLVHRWRKTGPLKISSAELEMACSTAAGLLGKGVREHYPAAEAIIHSVRESVAKPRDIAQEIESRDFVRLAKSETARNLVTLFISEQALKSENRRQIGRSEKVKLSAVLGAGIMGGGVAYQSASTGTPILMKDISQHALDLGTSESNRLIQGQIKRGKWQANKGLEVSQLIQPTLNYNGFDQVGLVVEAVVEDVNVKRAVLAEVEQQVSEETVLATNTSTLTVDELATGLSRPQNLCGMHFFNPVHMMRLVEIIRGDTTSDAAVARAVSYAVTLNKLPIVVKDCSGFLVNRILLPYIHAFTRLVVEGVDFRFIDKTMEKFGWPMGPATLMDIVGMDTGCHAAAVMARAYPERMSETFRNATQVLNDAGRLGQKSGAGYYRYELDSRKRLKKVVDPETDRLIAEVVTGCGDLNAETVVERMMIPLCLEAVRCLEEQIGRCAGDIDVALVNSIGFPRYLGGAFGYIDAIGVRDFVALCDRYAYLGVAYQPTEQLRAMAASNQSFYQY